MFKRIFNFVFWIYLLALLILNVIPDVPAPEIKTGDEWIRLDYAIHFLMYFIAGLLLYYSQKSTGQRAVFLHLSVMVIYAGFSEILQLWIPGRTFNPVDLVYNLLGVVVGTLLPLVLIKKKFSNTH